jgi:hypothetical protein
MIAATLILVGVATVLAFTVVLEILLAHSAARWLRLNA